MIIYTDHAEDRVVRRFIKKQWVEDAIKNPDKLLDAPYSRKQAIKKINSDEISVIYVKEDSNFIIVTVFWGR